MESQDQLTPVLCSDQTGVTLFNEEPTTSLITYVPIHRPHVDLRTHSSPHLDLRTHPSPHLDLHAHPFPHVYLHTQPLLRVHLHALHANSLHPH